MPDSKSPEEVKTLLEGPCVVRLLARPKRGFEVRTVILPGAVCFEPFKESFCILGQHSVGSRPGGSMPTKR